MTDPEPSNPEPSNLEPKHYVVDSFAILALLGEEAGAERVQQLLEFAKEHKAEISMSVLNLGEVVYITERSHGLAKAQEVLAAIEQLPLTLLPATQKRVLAAAHIKANHPVAYADAFAIAACQELGAIALTGDPEFQAVKDLIQIEWLSQNENPNS